MAALPEPSRHIRGPYRSGIRRRGEILDSATRVFGQHGYAGGTLKQIAEDVGCSPAALVRHFATKEDLLIAVLLNSDARNGEELFGASEGIADFDNSVRLVAHNIEHRGLVELLLTVATEASNHDHPAHPHMVERYARHVDNLSRRLRDARERGEIRRFTDQEIEYEARGFVAHMDGLELQWLLDPEFDLLGAWTYHYLNSRRRWTEGIPPERLPTEPTVSR